MKSWIIILSTFLAIAILVEYGWNGEIEPIREPVYNSPRVYTINDGKVVFKEYFEGLTISRIEFFDPESGDLLYGVSLKDGHFVGKREGSAVGENDGSFDESGEIVEKKYLTHSGEYGFVTRELNGELGVYMVRGLGTKIPLHLSIYLEKGSILRAYRKFLLNNTLVEFKRNFSPNTYEELYFYNDGTKKYSKYLSGFLQNERHSIPTPTEDHGSLIPYNAFYLRGKHAFTIKSKFNKENIREEIAVYDAQDKLIGKVNPLLGESLYLKEEVVNGRKALQVIRYGQDRQEKVEAVMFEDE